MVKIKLRGQEKIRRQLENSIRNKRISHSLIFTGLEGQGKRALALEFAKSLLCKGPGDWACGECSSCLKFDKDNHPDFKLVEARKDIIRREQIEELIDMNKTMPFESQRKIALIDEAHLMNKEAQNNFLKTLEEPAEFLHFILVSSRKEELLPTILSRCMEIYFSQPSREDFFRTFEEDKRDRGEIDFLYAFTNGSIGKSLSLLDQGDFFDLREELLGILDDLYRGKLMAFSALNFFKGEKDRINEILDIMSSWYRDLLVYRRTLDRDLIINKDKIDIYSNQAQMSEDIIVEIIYKIEETRRNLIANINYDLSIEVLIFKILGGSR